MTNPIGWCDVTWNPGTGCLRGCEYCYARRIVQRLAGRYGYPKDDPFRPTWHEDRLGQPLRWKEPRRIFVGSMADIVGPWTPRSWVDAVLSVTRLCPQHTFIFLTKSPERLALFNPWPANAWVGATVDVRARLDPTLAALSEVAARVKFICFEPLLEYMGFPDFANAGVNWIIIGAETGSGVKHDGMLHVWVADLANCAMKDHVPVFCKDNLGWPFSKDSAIWKQFPKGGNTMKHVETGPSGGEDE